MMTIAQFKRMLELYGADITRWDGVASDEAKDLIRNSAAARALYKEAEELDDALDAFIPPPADAAILDRVMARIGGGPAPEAESAEMAPGIIPPRGGTKQAAGRGQGMPLYWSGALACVVALLVFMLMPGDDRRGGEETAVVVAQNAVTRAPGDATAAPEFAGRTRAAAEIELFLAGINELVVDEFAEQELIGLLARAETRPQPAGPVERPAESAEIDVFLDQILLPEEDAALQEEKDLLELLLAGSRKL